MAEVVIEVIALGLERIVVLILDFPSRAASGGKLGDVVFRDPMGRRPGIVEEHRVVLIGGDEFAPVDHQGIIGIAQRDVIDIAVGVGELFFPGAAGMNNGRYLGATGEVGHPFVED